MKTANMYAIIRCNQIDVFLVVAIRVLWGWTLTIAYVKFYKLHQLCTALMTFSSFGLRNTKIKVRKGASCVWVLCVCMRYHELL